MLIFYSFRSTLVKGDTLDIITLLRKRNATAMEEHRLPKILILYNAMPVHGT